MQQQADSRNTDGVLWQHGAVWIHQVTVGYNLSTVFSNLRAVRIKQHVHASQQPIVLYNQRVLP
jgi:hypothetical protein